MSNRLLSVIISLIFWSISTALLIMCGVKTENAVQAGAVFIGMSAFIHAYLEERKSKKTEHAIEVQTIKDMYLFSRTRSFVVSSFLLTGVNGCIVSIAMLSNYLLNIDTNSLAYGFVSTIWLFALLYLCGLYIGSKTIDIHFIDVLLSVATVVLIMFVFSLYGSIDSDSLNFYKNIPKQKFKEIVFFYAIVAIVYATGVYVGSRWRHILYIKKIIALLPEGQKQKAINCITNNLLEQVRNTTR